MDKISMITLLLARAYTDKKTSEVPAVIQYKGVTTTALSDGATTNPITINGSSYTAVNGDTVFYDGVAYTFDGTVWQETISLAQIITELEGLDEKIGDLTDLTTTDKDSVVDAINELVTAVGGKVDKVDGKGLSTNDYTDADAAIVAGVTTALAGKQDTLTFDSVPTDGSTNPVESNGVYDALATKANASDVTDALALKQDKTDNTLQTTDKTVVGGINELKSGLTNLDNEVNGDAVEYPYADVITIEDAIPANVADCKVKIEPVQDLHGYDHPWVGGAGKNKFIHSDQTFQNTGAPSNVFSDERIHGTATGTYYLSFEYKVLTASGNSQSLFYGKYNGSRISGGNIGSWFDSNVSSDWIKKSFTLNLSDKVINGIELYSNNALTVRNIMISATPITAFEPYENICPITGHTEASVERDGKNLCDKGEGNVYNGGKLIPVSAGDKIYCYGEWVSDNKSFYGAIFSTPTETSKGNKIAILDDFYTGVSKEMTIPTNGYFGVCFDTSVESYTVSKMMISRTPIASASDYEPYAGKTYTIALGDTIYGGTVDFDSGVMTVTHGIHACDGTETVKQASVADVFKIEYSRNNNFMDRFDTDGTKVVPLVSHYNGVAFVPAASMVNGTSTCYVGEYGKTIAFKDSNFTSEADFAAYLLAQYTNSTPVTFCLPLATPTTIQLTPQQIQLLKGTNTITASTGQISVTVNGVSGSIGQVQEQVNEIAEDVEDVQSGLAKLHYHKVAESAATGTRADKLASLYTTYNTLVNDVRKSAILLRNNADIFHAVNNSGTFSNVYVDTTTLLFMCVGLNPGSYVFNNNGTTTDGSSAENTEVWSLWIIE